MPLNDDERRLLETQHGQTVEWLRKLDDRLDASRQVTAGIAARLDAALDRMKSETAALTDARTRLSDRVATVEREYVRESEMRKLLEHEETRIDTLAAKIDTLAIRVSWYMGGIAVLVGILQVFGPTIARAIGIGN